MQPRRHVILSPVKKPPCILAIGGTDIIHNIIALSPAGTLVFPEWPGGVLFVAEDINRLKHALDVLWPNPKPKPWPPPDSNSPNPGNPSP